ncbi:MAG: cadherin-like domain-containing protein, partial [Actinobacteria bacterium]|nr:cadherin-like domain-containing protein [Actinomycetota bacterium]
MVAGAAVVASVIAISAVWPGLDAKSTPAVSAAVWALQTGDGRRYARVNTAIGELDTVRSIANPSAVAQSDSGAYVFSESFGKLTRINDALPANLDDEALRSSASTPAGTVDVAVSGDWVAYRTDSGAVFAGTLSGGEATQIDPNSNGDAQAPEYTSDAITVDDSGMLYSYSAADATVLRYRIGAAEVAGRDAVRDGPKGSESDLTAAGGVWFLVDPQQGQVWHRGSDTPQSISVVAGDVAYGRSTASGDAAWLADSSGLIKLPIDGSPPAREVGGQDTSKGRPARPIVFGGDVYAAWLGTTSGTLWRSGGQGESTLDYGGRTLGTDLRPVFVASDSSMILNETRSGWVWATPTGKLMPSSQNWALDDQTNPQTQPSNEQAAVVIDPKPPVAEPDTFGVRAGSLAALPVLLNDHDPNRDVLSIDPTSVTGLDPGFGTLSITDNGQRIAVQTAAGATGSATFSYRVTDGTAVDGLYSDPTTVTLSVAPNAQNSAPEWCSTPGCLATWPAPEVASGGTVTIPVMDGWVDPEGDPLMLLSVVNESGIGSVASTPAGEVVYQHPNASITDVQNIQLQVTVADTRGAATTKPLTVRVSPTPKLTATSFTVIDAQSSGTTIDVGTHVTGTAGKLSLSSVRVLDDARAEVVATAGSTSFDFTAQAPGTYRVSYTVSDGVSDANATARVTILPADAAAQLATAPVVAFVRPKEDVTVDVFTAVTNPTHRVLLLSNVVPSASPGASMSVDAVGQNYIRVSGATADGAPGLLGTIRYVVSDGTEDAGARIEGQATVYLLPPAPELAPIAVDDSVVVRAGAQIDIPVLDNDVAIAGGSMILNPASVRSSSDQALAFASGRTLRYLAPSTPGDYTVEYAVYTAGSPALADTATVHVSVISEESNRAPRPGTLEGRVLSGELTSIPFRSFGVDPDGDAVSLDRIVTQPASGSATLSADGESIVYSSVPGFRGQVSFTYRVTDSQGATGTATARVGVLDEQSNPSPVTFTDYVQLQVGAENSVRVSPLANDVDPTGGTLSITAVTPDVVQTLADGTPNDEFDRLSGLIETPSATEVVIRAGTTPGTMSFLYDVQSSSGNTARGLIVVKVVRESVPDFPVITDTVLTAQTRDRFPSGVDVVAGKVSWTGGNISDLTLSLWGAPAGVSVEGTRLRGDLPARTLVIPFALTGTSASGQNVTSYGFLRIPGEDDLALALRTGLADRQVEERASVSWNMLDLVGVPRGATIEVGDDVRPSGARTGAACVRESGTTIRYDAGAGAPWQDACIVPVRITGREDWTYLSVPVRVQALVPQPELTSASLTVAPGQTVTYDLAQLTTWQGGIAGTGVAYSVAYTGTRFVVTQQGSIVTVVGADDAVPGAEDAAIIGVTSQAAVAPARLILRVGAAPSTLPQGGTIAQQCSQASGSSCTFTVIGAGGEINPLPRTPLTVTSVRPTGACVGVSFSVVSATAVTATWTADAPGATCTAAFSVRDAQGRQTNSERDGQILLDLQGYPKAPSSITQTAYADGTLTLRVDPGDARLAYPALSSFVVRSQGAVVANCSAEGICPVISAPNGEQRVYEA